MTTTTTTIEARLDAICKRQTARFLDHLRSSNQATAKLENDTKRVFGFVFADIKQAVREHYPEATNEQAEIR